MTRRTSVLERTLFNLKSETRGDDWPVDMFGSDPFAPSRAFSSLYRMNGLDLTLPITCVTVSTL